MDRSENMKRIRAQDISIEIKLRKALWSKGYRYRKNCKDVYGTPDICFKSRKIAIFCDSDFWHGRSYLENKNIPKTNTEFWINMNDTEWGQIIDLCIEVGISLEAVGITKDMGFYEALTLVYFYIKGLLEEEYLEEENEFAYEQVRYQKM